MTSANSPRHILFAASQTANRSNGGLESATRIFEALAGEFRWTFVTNRESDFTRRWRQNGATVTLVTDVTAGGPVGRAIGRALLAFKLRQVIARNQPDIIHANDIRMLRVLSGHAQTKTPLIFTVRDTKPSGGYGRAWDQGVARCERVVALSDEMKARLLSALELGADERFKTINSIVDLVRFNPARAKLRKNQNAGVSVGVIGALMAKKRQIDLLERVVPSVTQDVPDAEFHFIGDCDASKSPYAARFLAAAKNASFRDQVVIHGHRDDIAECYGELDILLIGSEREGLARAMIEAMASGVPVVSFDVCSAREMLEETGAGIVVPQGDFDGLVRAVTALANDPPRRAAMGAAGRAVAEERFSPARARGAWLDLYHEVAESARRRLPAA